jgi:hypothetical protein
MPSNSSKKVSSHSHSQSLEVEDPWIPEGFEEVEADDRTKYIVPEFMVETLQQAYCAKKKKEELKAFKASGSVSIIISR